MKEINEMLINLRFTVARTNGLINDYFDDVDRNATSPLLSTLIPMLASYLTTVNFYIEKLKKLEAERARKERPELKSNVIRGPW